LVCATPISIVVGLVIGCFSPGVRAHTTMTLGNNSPAVSGATTVNITYVDSDGTERQVIQLSQDVAASREALEKLLPSLGDLVDSRLNQIVARERKEKRAQAEIENHLKRELLTQLASMTDALQQLTPENVALNLRAEFLKSATELSTEMQIVAEARCSEGDTCASLTHIGSTPAVRIDISGKLHESLAGGVLDLDTVSFRCLDADTPHEPAVVQAMAEPVSRYPGLASLIIRREGNRNANLRASLTFTPRWQCSDLEVTATTISPTGAAGTVSTHLKVVAEDVWVGDTLGMIKEASWELSERRLLPFVPFATGAARFNAYKSELFLLSGAEMVHAGREFEHRLQRIEAPPPMDQKTYLDLVKAKPWDLWSFAGRSFCVLDESAAGDSEDVTGAVQRWQHDCEVIESEIASHLLSRKYKPSSIKTSFNSRYPSYTLRFDTQTRDVGSWTVGPINGLQRIVPVLQRNELIYIQGGDRPSDSLRLRVNIVGQPDIWLGQGASVFYGFTTHGFWEWNLSVPILWDILEVAGRLDTDGGDDAGAAGSLRLSLCDFVSLLMGVPAPPFVFQMGWGAEIFDFPTVPGPENHRGQFFDLFTGWVGRVSDSRYLWRVGASWRLSQVGGVVGAEASFGL